MSKTVVNLDHYKNYSLPTLYQQQIHLTKYSRWIDDLSRRETWPETVFRYCDFIINHIYTNFGYLLTQEEQVEIYEAILQLENMPSMRAMMTAGRALELDNAAGYNCGFLLIDNLKAHDEAFYLSMCSAGVGFSVERQFINDCPDLPRELHKTDTTIIVPDTRIGWASSYRQLLTMLFDGFIPKWDVSRVRKAGARLIIFGGRASGPGPLVNLFDHAVHIVSTAIANGQRKLTSIQHHDLFTKMADVACSGGVRRAATISLSNPSDERMRDAKSGNWWEQHPHFRLANNSSVWTDMPEAERFMSEFLALIKSQSGERGIINRQALVDQCKKFRRIDIEKYADSYGVNPCFAGETLIITDDGAFPIEELVYDNYKNVYDGISWKAVNNFQVTGQNQQMLKIVLQDGSSIRVTPYHTMITDNNNECQAKELKVGDKLLLNDVTYNGDIDEPGAYIKGFLLGDGNLRNFNTPMLSLYYPKYVCQSRLISSANELPLDYTVRTNATLELGFYNQEWFDGEEVKERKGMKGLTLRKNSLYQWCNEFKNKLPLRVHRWSYNSKIEFIAGLFDADGCITDTKSNGFSYQISSIHKEMLIDLQIILKSMGIHSNIGMMNKARLDTSLPGKEEGYLCQDCWRLTIGQAGSIILSKAVKFSRLKSFSDRKSIYDVKPRMGKIVSIGEDGIDDFVYCCTVPDTHRLALGIGIITGQCSEVVLRPKQLCNLSNSILRHDDNLQIILKKTRIATILGTVQSTLTNFRYLSPEWKFNCEEERLLGVSLNGIMDNRFMAGLDYIRDGTYLTENFVQDGVEVELPGVLNLLRDVAVETNIEWADKIGINPSAAITSIKPEGNNSNLVDCRPGIHGAHSRDFYIRTNRANKVDKLAAFIIKQGVYTEDDVSSPDTAWVLHFPITVPKDAITRHDYTAIEHLKIWKLYQTEYCEHKPSITISVKDKEWPSVAAFVYENFDIMSGVAFLPFDGGNYRQAPYQVCTREEFAALVAKTPTSIDWSKFSENDDYTEGAKELACVGDVCSL